MSCLLSAWPVPLRVPVAYWDRTRLKSPRPGFEVQNRDEARQADNAQAGNAQQIREIEGVSEYRLPNGIPVLLYPDPSLPQFTMNMTVMVGSRHEGYGESGMAHLTEHMLFRGTTTKLDIPKLLKDRGVLSMNATTSSDRTNFFETLPASDENLEFVIEFEADRLMNSLTREEDFESELAVVRNEFERAKTNPSEVLMQRMNAAAFEWHNYGKTTMGHQSAIECISLDDLRHFYQKHYQPDNIQIVIAGKFDQEKALNYLTKYFGTLELPDRELPWMYTREPVQDGERTVTLRRYGNVQIMGLSYHIPAVSHEDYAACAVWANILGATPSGVLYKSLLEKEIVSDIFVRCRPSHDPGLLTIMCSVPVESDLVEAKQALVHQVEQFGVDRIDEQSIRRAIASFTQKREQLLADSERLAIQLANWHACGDYRLFFLHRDRMEQVKVADVKRVAEKYFIRSNRTVGLFYPNEEKLVQARIPEVCCLEHLLAGYQGRESTFGG